MSEEQGVLVRTALLGSVLIGLVCTVGFFAFGFMQSNSFFFVLGLAALFYALVGWSLRPKLPRRPLFLFAIMSLALVPVGTFGGVYILYVLWTTRRT